MIVRTWRASADRVLGPAYERHFEGRVAPALAKLPGNRGAWLLRREVDGRTEFLALTLWDSLASIQAFAGTDIDKAHVEPEARSALSQFDEFADHYDLVLRIDRPA